MMKKKKMYIVIITLVIMAIIGTISYSLLKEEKSTQQVKGETTSSAKVETTAYTFRLILNPDPDNLNLDNPDDEKKLQYLFVVTTGTQKGIYTDADCTNKIVAGEGNKILVPKKSGNVFNGYFYAQRCLISNTGMITTEIFNEYTSGSISQDIVCNASWTPITSITYKINFDANGGVNPPESMTLTGITSGTLPNQEPTQIGYRFIIWGVKSTKENIDDYENWCISGGKFDLNNLKKDNYSTIDDYMNKIDDEHYEINMYAIWEEAIYTYRIILNQDKDTTEGLTKYLYVKQEDSGEIKQGIYTSPSCIDEFEISNKLIKTPATEKYQFNGYVDTNNQTIISSDRIINDENRNTLQTRDSNGSDYTLSASWTQLYDDKILLYYPIDNGEELENKEEVTHYLYRRKNDGIYKDNLCTQKIQADKDGEIVLPKRTDYIFKQYKSGNYIINEKGNISTATLNYLITGNDSELESSGGIIQFTAEWYYKIALYNKGTKIAEISAKYGDFTAKIKDKIKEIEEKYKDSFGAYREDGKIYTFSGDWSTKLDTNYPYQSNTVVSPITFYAWYNSTETTEKFNYKITLNSKVGTEGTKGTEALYIVKDGKKIYTDPECTNGLTGDDKNITIPTRPGYKFNGYKIKENSAEKEISSEGKIITDYFTETVSQDGTLVADWIQIYKITLDSNGDSEGLKNLYLLPDEGIYYDSNCNNIVEKLTTIPSKTGYTFGGYKLKDETTDQVVIVINSDGTWNDLDNIKHSSDYKKDFTLLAIWNLQQYKITYNGMEGVSSTSSSNPETYTIEDEIALKQPIKSRYTFTGWTGSNGEEQQKEVTITKGSTGDKEYTANWEYTNVIKFDKAREDGGTTELYYDENGTIYSDKDFTTEIAGYGKIDVPTRPGYKFTGYFLKGEDTSASEKKSFNDQGQYMPQEGTLYSKLGALEKPKGEINLVAQWSPMIDKVSGNPTQFTKEDVTLTIEANPNVQLAEEPYSFDGGTTWQAENSKTYTENTSDIKIQVKDSDGNIGNYKDSINIDKIDKVPPKLTVSYIKVEENKIKATIEANEELQGLNGWTLIENCRSMEKEFTENFKGDITVSDLAGNTSTIEITIEIPEPPVTPIYTIEFNTNGGTGETQYLYLKDKKLYTDSNCTTETTEIDKLPTQEGYTFKGYKIGQDGTIASFDATGKLIKGGELADKIENQLISENQILYAIWEKNEEPEVTEAKYTIEHYKEQEDKTYSLEETENKTGTVGKTVTATQKTYEGYIYNSSKSNDNGVVVKEGTLVLKMYYSLEENVTNYTVKYYKEDSTGNYIEVTEDKTIETGKIGDTVTAKVKAYEGYMYNSEQSKGKMTGVVKEKGTLELGVYYRKLKNIYIEITVKDLSTQEIKENVKVTLYDSEEKEVSNMTSDILGKVAFESLEKGKTYSYKIEGDSKEYKFKVTEDGKIEYITDEEQKPDDDNNEDNNDNQNNQNNVNNNNNQNTIGNNSSTTQNKVSGNVDNTKANSILPNAGIKGKIILSVITLLICGICIFYVKYKRLNKIC